MSARTSTLWPVILRFTTTAVCWAVCAADSYGFLVYWPSGRPETRFERVMHGLLGPGLFLIGCVFLVTGIRRLNKRPPPDPSICPACGYDLRASPDRCPECGRRSSHAAAAVSQSVAAPAGEKAGPLQAE